VLFNLIQETATTKQLKDIKKQHIEVPFIENETDMFWA
jgi:hypothetical protein